MKRQEMIRILKVAINERLYQDYQFTDDTDEQISNILTDIENAGMEPPKVQNRLIRPENYPYGAGCSMRCSCEDCDPTYLVNKWEEEQ